MAKLDRCPREIFREGKRFWYIRSIQTKAGVKAQKKSWKKHKPYLKTRSVKKGSRYCFYVGGVK